MKTTKPIKEASRIRQVENLWVVEIFSAAIGQWITQGVWLIKENAEADLKNWL